MKHTRKITSLSATVTSVFLLAACNAGNGNTNSNNPNNNVNAAYASQVNATTNTESTAFDPTRIGFAAKFQGQNTNVQVAFSPYNVANDTHTATDCESADAIYNLTIAPIKQLSPNTTLDTVWNKDEYFNCNDGITKMIVQAINSAQKSIYAAVYDFNNPDITYALIQKKITNPNIDIEVIADQSNLTNTDSMIQLLKTYNIPVFISSAYSIMHNKFMVFDGISVEYGSFNYSTTAAAEQANNAILINDSNISQTYTDRWNEIKQNESTSVYAVGQSTYTNIPYIPSGYTDVVPSVKTGEVAKQIYSINLANADIDVVHELANYVNTNLTCPTDIESIGGICLPDYYFSSKNQATNKYVYHINTPLYGLINSAKTSIQIAVFAFTDKEMVADLIAAKQRGVKVQVIADNNWNTSPGVNSAIVPLTESGIEVRVNSNYEILHNKYMIVDGQTVQTGSYNYTASGHGSNAENYQIYYNQVELAAVYQQDWQAMFDQGTPFIAPAK